MNIRHGKTLRTCLAACVITGALGIGLATWSGVAAQPQAPQPQPAPDQADKMTSGRISMPIDRNARRKLDSVKEYVEKEQWGEAVQVLQSLLNKTEETFVEDEKKRRVSVWAEADRLLASLPKDGLEHYELQYGGDAKAMLKKAKATGDAGLLAEIEHRYKQSEAGLEAAILRGTYHLDRVEYVLAALCFERLLQRPGVMNKADALTLYKAMIAFERAGDVKNRDRVWPELVRRVDQGNDNSLPPVLRRMRVEQLKTVAALKDESRQFRGRFDWPVFLGSVERSAQTEGGAPFLESRFAMSTLVRLPLDAAPDRSRKQQAANDLVTEWVTKAIRKLDQTQAPVLSGFHPIAVGDRLIFRSYRGVHVVDVKKTEELWPEAMNTQMSLYQVAHDISEIDNNQSSVKAWVGKYLTQEAAVSIFFDNTMLGTLSTDNTFVYVVEDLAIPPHPEDVVSMMANQQRGNVSPLLRPWMECNKLTAYDLSKEGKTAWTIGTDAPDQPFSDVFFLGPPLPLAGKLYVLAEVRREILLMCLETQPERSPGQGAQARLVWSKMLCNADREITADPIRRTQAVHLAYGDGILVCPTHAGAIFGVDLLTRTNTWAHSYLDGSEQSAIQGNLPVLPGRPFNRNYTPYSFVSASWSSTAPMISDGKVVFTAPDGKYLTCLNLRDGTLAWQHGKGQNELYLAGVWRGKALVVAKDSCYALHLADGKQAWKTEASVPAGRGVANDTTYFLPLKSGEVWALDIDKGTVLGKSRAPRNDVPGNLIFHDGDVISQTATGITIFPQLAVKEREISERLAKNPNDSAGLLSRGELRLYKGDLTAAVDDLHASLQHQPSDDVRKRGSEKLYQALSDLLERDFATNERYLPEYETLSRVAAAPDETETQRQERLQKEKGRRSKYLRLVARGREAQGRLREALQAYVEFASFGGEELVALTEDSSTKALPRIWATSRISAMLEKAQPDQKNQLEAAIREQREAAEKDGTIEALERFVNLFGSTVDAGRAARLLLAERYLEKNQHAQAELELLVVSRQGNTTVAAKGLEALARLYVKRGQLEHAATAYRDLAQKFSKTTVRDGKTGYDIWLELWTDKRFLPYLEEMRRGWLSTVAIRAHHPAPMDVKALMNVQWLEAAPDAPEAFRQQFLYVDAPGTVSFRLVDRTTDRNRPLFTLVQTGLRAPPISAAQGATFRPHYHVSGQTLIIPWGQFIHAFDLAQSQSRPLWSYNLLGSLEPSRDMGHSLSYQDDGTLLMHTQNNLRIGIGKLAYVDAATVCVVNQDKELVAIDPTSGAKLWVKQGVDLATRFFGDGERLYAVVPTDKSDSSKVSGVAIRLTDGLPIDLPDFAQLYQKKLRILDGKLLLLDTPKEGGVELRLRDLAAGLDEWTRVFPAQTRLLNADGGAITAVMEPGGRVVILDNESGKDLLTAPLGQEGTNNLQADVHVLQDAHHFYLACNAPDNQLPQGVQRRISPAGRVLRSLPVHGRVAAYDRHTGQEKWHALVPPQHLVIDQFQDVPMLLFASYQAKYATAPGTRVNEQFSLVSALDKRDGAVINVPNNQLPQSTLTLQMLQVRAGAGKVVVAGSLGGMTNASYVIEFLTNGQATVGGDGEGMKRFDAAVPGGARIQPDNRDLIRRALEAEEAQRRVIPRKDG